MLNSNIIVPNIDTLTYKEWLSVRKSGLGGSDIAAALGLSPWKSALELWQEKVSGQSQPQQENEAMIWGRIMEPIIAREFVKRSGLQVNPFRSMLYLFFIKVRSSKAIHCVLNNFTLTYPIILYLHSQIKNSTVSSIYFSFKELIYDFIH